MIELLILVVALTTQEPSDEVIIPLQNRRAATDLEFTYAVEESILREPGLKTPSDIDKLLGLMDNNTCKVREAAHKKLFELCQKTGDIRWLFWGRRWRGHPEVQLRCNNLLKKLFPCKQCIGDNNRGMCYGCLDVGSEWPLGAFD